MPTLSAGLAGAAAGPCLAVGCDPAAGGATAAAAGPVKGAAAGAVEAAMEGAAPVVVPGDAGAVGADESRAAESGEVGPSAAVGDRAAPSRVLCSSGCRWERTDIAAAARKTARAR